MSIFNRGRHYKKRALWKRIVKWTVLSLLTAIIVVGLAAFIFVYHTLGKINENTGVIVQAKQSLDIPAPNQPENILVMGADQDPDSNTHRSDTMMLIRVNPQGDCLSILSIPRDLIVSIPGHGQDKINAAYSWGGVSLAIQTVKKLTGEPIHHFVVVNFNGFSKAVDALGGIYVDVDHRYFNDNSTAAPGQAYDPIDIYPGYQRLDGHDALAYVRFRHTDSDFMRIKRQQFFIQDAKSQSLQWGNITKIPEIADAFASNTTSDIGQSEVLSLAKFLLDLNKGHIYQAQVPVKATPDTVLLDKPALPGVLKQFESPSFETPQPVIPGSPPPQIPSDNTKKLSIAVLNGNGQAGSAALAAGLLKQKGCANASVGGDANNNYADNEVYFQNGQDAAANELATLFKPCKVEPMPAGMSSAQLVIVVGASFAGALTQQQPAVKAPLHFVNDSKTGERDWEAASLQLPFKVEKPASFPREFSYADAGFRTYNIDTGDGPKPALKVVGQDQNGNYWGIMETTFTQSPLLQAPSVQKQIGGRTYRFYYEGDQLRYLAWQDGDVACWITNSLQGSLDEETMVQLATSFKPL